MAGATGERVRNLHAALRWALESGEADLGLWFGGALAEFWYMSENLAEARRWLEAALANGEGAWPTPARTRALVRAGWIAWEQGDYDGSAALSEASLALSRELGDEAGAVAALSNLGWAALLGDDLDRASAYSEEAVELAQGLDLRRVRQDRQPPRHHRRAAVRGSRSPLR